MRDATFTRAAAGVALSVAALLGATAPTAPAATGDAPQTGVFTQVRPAASADEDQLAGYLIDEHRRVCGTTLRRDDRLNNLATHHSQYMAGLNNGNGVLTHEDPWGDLNSRFRHVGYQPRWVGETVYWGSGTNRGPHAVMYAPNYGWMNSPPHRAIIQNCRYTDFGVGSAVPYSATGKTFWTAEFGSR
ncbi:CAP domain-containing protein [Goodfellowiella coeruleoviolacea]|uniref:Conserved protein YkwD, contains CAP (CSP/antigen 5/PR1) domain n=1 Tax=Goodfellowiella coeruleoviolacea TaxID=334858 RepID=A0AAE3GJI8_9PSEU|nr:CAP domain-containing protein [Goodfellowiella coeruleoviolacea]MCP2168509.1 putative conserved protein YkwD, contains CAP (CSP/antigen 5/PR1) domain [Goodfellowiella coeruleoviolacea]